jgi:hypothetical protein
VDAASRFAPWAGCVYLAIRVDCDARSTSGKLNRPAGDNPTGDGPTRDRPAEDSYSRDDPAGYRAACRHNPARDRPAGDRYTRDDPAGYRAARRHNPARHHSACDGVTGDGTARRAGASGACDGSKNETAGLIARRTTAGEDDTPRCFDASNRCRARSPTGRLDAAGVGFRGCAYQGIRA